MLTEFAAFLERLFPSIEPQARRRFVDAIQKSEPLEKRLYAVAAPDGVCQGDIFEPLPFRYLDDDGQWLEQTAPGLVMCNTCDAEWSELLPLAACHDFAEMERDAAISATEGFLNSIRANEKTDVMYLPEVVAHRSLVCDFGAVSAFSRLWLQAAVRRGDVRRICSLSQLGYYMLLAKLTVYYMRPET